MTTLTQNAYAKINLTLDVGTRRADGYHDVRSVMQTIALHDTLTATLIPSSPGIHLEVIGSESLGVPSDAANIVHKAAVRLQKIAAARGTFPGSRSGLHITLHKRIPSQAGLGGGSSDAAAALRLVNALLDLTLSPARLAGIGASLGADVPFFLAGGTALAEGLGEQITPLPAPDSEWPLLVLKPPVGVSTPAAYAALDALPGRLPGSATKRWLNGDLVLQNDFETVILPLYPEVASAYHLLSQTMPQGKGFKPLLCGSGSALFLRTTDASEAERIAGIIQTARIGSVWVTQTIGTIR